MERIYPVFVPEENINEDEIEHSEVVQWCYNHMSHKNVLSLNLTDLSLLQYESKVLDIINRESNGMLQIGEDDWIISNDIKLKIKIQLEYYLEKIPLGREKDIVNSLICLLDISIKTNRNLYFIF